MTTSRSTFALSRPSGAELVTESTFSYLRTRNRLRTFDLIQREFEEAGITQAALASRMGKDPGQLNRLLGAPGNWTLDTVSDLLFAICGGVPNYAVDHPLDKPARNSTRPPWAFDHPWTSTDSSADTFHVSDDVQKTSLADSTV
jgi:hypothetical protein